MCFVWIYYNIQVVLKIDSEVVKILSDSISKEKMSRTVMFEEDKTASRFSFFYDVSDFGGDNLPFSETENLIFLAEGEEKFETIYYQRHYFYGEIIPAGVSDFSGGFKYSDNTIIPFSEMVKNGANLVELTSEVTSGTVYGEDNLNIVLTKATGTNTAIKTREVATMAPETSSIETMVASLGDNPFSMCRCTFSTTTIASSTTIPITSTIAKRVSVLIEKPKAQRPAIVPIRDTGTEIIGINVARQFCKNKKIATKKQFLRK